MAPPPSTTLTILVSPTMHTHALVDAGCMRDPHMTQEEVLRGAAWQPAGALQTGTRSAASQCVWVIAFAGATITLSVNHCEDGDIVAAAPIYRIKHSWCLVCVKWPHIIFISHSGFLEKRLTSVIVINCMYTQLCTFSPLFAISC